MTTRTPLSINMSAIRVEGIGGLGLFATIVIVAIAIPTARWLLIGSVLAGAIAAAVAIRRRRDGARGTPGDGKPVGIVLHDSLPPAGGPADEPAPGRPAVPRLAISY